MKILVSVVSATLFTLFSAYPTTAADNHVIQNAITTKFSQSSKGILKSVELKNGHIKVTASKAGLGDANDITIDTAIALNRINNNIAKWKSVAVVVNSKTLSFTRNDFDAFRAGKINDPQFIKRLKRGGNP
jgi:hypothetical protein